MKKINKKAFTIVELVVVISVIAILAAVLIPTFSNLIERANISNDTMLVKNLNTALTVESVSGKVDTMHDVIENLDKQGFELTKITPRSSGDIVWDQENNKFALIGNDESLVFAHGNSLASNKTKIWKIVYNQSEIKDDYSYYLGDGFSYTYDANGQMVVKTGIDVGNNKGLVIKYEPDANKDVILRTNGGKLIINDNNGGIQNHYGIADEVEIIKTHTNSYHEFGLVSSLELKEGHLKVENGATVYNLSIPSGSNPTVTNDGKIIAIKHSNYAKINEIMANNYFNREENKTADNGEILVNNAEELNNAINNESYKTIILNNNINIDIQSTSGVDYNTGYFKISRDLTIDGNGYAIIVSNTSLAFKWGTDKVSNDINHEYVKYKPTVNEYNIFWIKNDTGNVTIKNLEINGNYRPKHAINGFSNFTLENVTIHGFRGSAINTGSSKENNEIIMNLNLINLVAYDCIWSTVSCGGNKNYKYNVIIDGGYVLKGQKEYYYKGIGLNDLEEFSIKSDDNALVNFEMNNSYIESYKINGKIKDNSLE